VWQQDNLCRTYSPQYLHELYTQALDCIKLERAASASGVYYYDEQFLKADGKEICRLAVRDQVTGRVLLDKMDADASETAIKKALSEALDGLPVEAFTIDMAIKYPGIIAGAKAKTCHDAPLKNQLTFLQLSSAKLLCFQRSYNTASHSSRKIGTASRCFSVTRESSQQTTAWSSILPQH